MGFLCVVAILRYTFYLLLSPYNVFFFFFKQKTAYEMRISDWSSDVCSSDLVASNRRLRLEFQGGMDGVLGYLNRMGFFHQLDGAAEVAPYRPTISGTPLQRGSNKGLVEIERIEASESAQRDVILRLGEAVERG